MDFISFFTFISSGWMLIHTTLLALVLLYWLTVIVGALDFDMFDLELDFNLDATEGLSGALSALAGFLNIDKVPLTIVFSFVIAKMWFIGYCTHYFFPSFINNTLPYDIIGGLIFVVSFFPAAIATAYTTRPLGKLFKDDIAISNTELVGHECTIITGRVDQRFGEAKLVINNDHLQISVRTDDETQFKRGESAVIFDYNEETNTYKIAKIEIN